MGRGISNEQVAGATTSDSEKEYVCRRDNNRFAANNSKIWNKQKNTNSRKPKQKTNLDSLWGGFSAKTL